MILYGNDFLHGSLLQIFGLDSLIDVIMGRFKHLKLSFPNCSEERRSTKHNDIPSRRSLRAYLWFKYPTSGVDWLGRFLRNSLYRNGCLMTMRGTGL